MDFFNREKTKRFVDARANGGTCPNSRAIRKTFTFAFCATQKPPTNGRRFSYSCAVNYYRRRDSRLWRRAPQTITNRLFCLVSSPSSISVRQNARSRSRLHPRISPWFLCIVPKKRWTSVHLFFGAEGEILACGEGGVSPTILRKQFLSVAAALARTRGQFAKPLRSPSAPRKNRRPTVDGSWRRRRDSNSRYGFPILLP